MYGHLLMCDEKKSCLTAMLRMNKTRQWHDLRIRHSEQFTPCDAILDANNNLLVLNFADKSLVKLKLVDHQELPC